MGRREPGNKPFQRSSPPTTTTRKEKKKKKKKRMKKMKKMKILNGDLSSISYYGRESTRVLFRRMRGGGGLKLWCGAQNTKSSNAKVDYWISG